MRIIAKPEDFISGRSSENGIPDESRMCAAMRRSGFQTTFGGSIVD
ncbi:hypothetical protein HMPREF3156_02420 [Neisseria sp. HMSC06F02]|nr:hypothetical protein HMPREF3156_02420 [Neisseria sp. HMSC06F02]